MSTTPKDTLTRVGELVQGIAETQANHGDLLRTIAERQDEIIKLLTPEPKDEPGLDELLASIVRQLTELTGYARQIAKAQAQMEQSLPGDVARAVNAKPGDHAAGNGVIRSGRV